MTLMGWLAIGVALLVVLIKKEDRKVQHEYAGPDTPGKTD